MTAPILGLTVEQVAEATGLSVTWLNQLRGQKRGPAYIKVGRRILYSPDAIRDWLAAHTQQTKAA